MKRETISASGTAVLAEAQAEPLAEDTLSEDSLAEDTLIDEELLIEEISIDGMCGVY
ncbi:MAG: mycofactocin precursor MftA [bacterium]|nr:mycofactocin precursor MftA [bacterium]MXZ30318.1 mycofactocin precursor [Acidimicrobiia bacterium]MYK87174.1 mycofactocin precursor [Acidobacteriota bacterium]MDE0670017.1 mycofactocin precursor MftA [bacterium]MYB25594.1 mycofactocin precursor [Acidimicrobiia bacterium]